MKRQVSSVEKSTSFHSHCCSITVPVIAISITVGLFTIPIIFFYTSKNSSADTHIHSYGNNTTGGTINVTNCTSLSWGEHQLTSRSQCTNVLYEGTICKDVLETWKRCATNSKENDQLYVHVNGSLDSKEKEIIDLNTYLIHDTECQKVALPFLCQYQFPLQHCSSTASSSGIIYTATREDCIDISTGVCAQLWSLAVSLGYSNVLPNCQQLPSSVSGVNRSTTNNDSESYDAFNITCKDDFIEINSTCIPRCDKFEGITHSGTHIVVYSEIIASIFGLIVSVIIIGLSLVKIHKTMFMFPSILIIFQVIDYSIIALLVLIISFKKNKLMCSSVSLIDSVQYPTPFCILSGALFHYTLLNWILFWFFHICTFFYQVIFPFHANRMKKLGRNKYIFAAITILGVILPLPPIIICLLVEKHKYHLHRFPPTICISYSDMWFYSVTLILDVLVAIGVCLLIIVCWALHQKKGKVSLKLSTAEKKLIFIFTSFIIFAVFTLAHVSHNTAKSDKYLIEITEYFKCEALGYVPGKCTRSHFEGIYNPYMSSFAYSVMGLMPLSILNYVLKWKWFTDGNRSIMKRVKSWKSNNSTIIMSSNQLSSS